MKNTIFKKIYQHIFLCVFILSAMDCDAQNPLIPNDSSEAKTEEVPSWNPDSLGRRNPRGTVEGFIEAVAAENYARAGLYLRLDSALKKNQKKEKLARSLQQLLDKDGEIIPYSLMSDDPAGAQDDNLGPNLEKVGTASINNEQFDIILERTEGPDGGPLWLFSSETIQRLPLLVEEAPMAPFIERVSPKALRETKWGGVPVSHWLGSLVFFVISYLFAWGTTLLILFLIPIFYRNAKKEPIAGVLKAFALPVRLYLAIWLFSIATQQAGISIILRQSFSNLTVIIGIVALLLLFWELIEVTTSFFEKRLGNRRNQAGVSALIFLRRTAKVALIVLGVILILDTVGFDVTTGLAALGIGGIALALGAQKTVENFVGSVTLIADQPVRVGDYCKVGDISGTVEKIGMRSTRIRTNDRTIVTIPNGDFASEKIENYAHRDQFLFNTALRLSFETSPEQMRSILGDLRSVLQNHPKIDPSPARIRFVEIGADGLKLEIYAYIKAADQEDYLKITEELYLVMMEAIRARGAKLAFPSRRIYISEDKESDDPHREGAE